MALSRRKDEHARARARLQLIRPRAARTGDWQRYALEALRPALPDPKTAFPTLGEAGRLALLRLEPQLREHTGAYVAVDVDSGRWLVAKTVTELLKKVRVQLPDRRVYLSRVGEAHVYQVRAR